MQKVKIVYDKLDAIVKSGANAVLSELPIGDLTTQYFADRARDISNVVQDVSKSALARIRVVCI